MRNYYAYLWVDENGDPKYVGKGTGARALEHAKREDFVQCSWTVRLFPAPSEAAAKDMEQALYLRLTKAGHALLNKVVPGGSSGYEKNGAQSRAHLADLLWETKEISCYDALPNRIMGKRSRLVSFGQREPAVKLHGKRVPFSEFAAYVREHPGYPQLVHRGGGSSYADHDERETLALMREVREALGNLRDRGPETALHAIDPADWGRVERVLTEGRDFVERVMEARERLNRMGDALIRAVDMDEEAYRKVPWDLWEARVSFAHRAMREIAEGVYDDTDFMVQAKEHANAENARIRKKVDEAWKIAIASWENTKIEETDDATTDA